MGELVLFRVLVFSLWEFWHWLAFGLLARDEIGLGNRQTRTYTYRDEKLAKIMGEALYFRRIYLRM